MTEPNAATSSTPDHDGGGAASPGADGEPGGIGSMLYKLALAGVGALILAQEEIEAAWKRARREPGPDGVDGSSGPDGDSSGAGAAIDGAAPTHDGAEHDGAPAPGAPDGSRVWLQIDAAIGRVLRTLSIPTREEVDAVSSKLDALATRIEARARR